MVPHVSAHPLQYYFLGNNIPVENCPVVSYIVVGGGVRGNIFRYPLQKMEVIFLSGEITVVRNLVVANPHVHIP